MSAVNTNGRDRVEMMAEDAIEIAAVRARALELGLVRPVILDLDMHDDAGAYLARSLPEGTSELGLARITATWRVIGVASLPLPRELLAELPRSVVDALADAPRMPGSIPLLCVADGGATVLELE